MVRVKTHVWGDTERCRSSPGAGCWPGRDTRGTALVGGLHSVSAGHPPRLQIADQIWAFPGNTQRVYIISLEICKEPTLWLKALNTHSITHLMYIQMEMLSAIKMWIKKKKRLTHNVDKGRQYHLSNSLGTHCHTDTKDRLNSLVTQNTCQIPWEHTVTQTQRIG